MLKDDFLDYEAMNNDFTYWPGSVKSLAVARPHACKHGNPENRSVDKSIRTVSMFKTVRMPLSRSTSN